MHMHGVVTRRTDRDYINNITYTDPDVVDSS
jgi:hypothetical protein